MLISYFMRKIVFWQNRNNREHDNEDYLDKDISSNLEENIEFFKAILGNSNDIKIHEFMFGDCCEFNGALIYIDGLVNNLEITESILKPIILNKDFKEDMMENLKIRDF